MSTLTATNLGRRLAETPDIRRAGAVLVEALVEEWGADAAVAWLPEVASEAVRSDDVIASGEVFLGSGRTGLLTALREQRLDGWFSQRGIPAVRAADLGARPCGVIAAAWRDEAAVPPRMDAVLGILASHMSLLGDCRRLEADLADAQAAQAEADEQISRTRRVRAMGEMASGIVHDFNNALTSILGYAELALGPLQEGDAFHNDLSSIRTAALDAAALVRRLQSLGRKGRASDEREVTDLREVARHMPALARPRWMQRSQCEGVAFEIVVDAQPTPLVNVVVAEIRELMLNLLFNAVDAMPVGGRITITTGADANGWAVMSVADEGTGMPEDVRERVFQPFFSTKGDHGSGLGLSVCQTIAARHAAHLGVESKPGAGTTFTLKLPPAAPGAVAASSAARARVVPVPDSVPRRILLVDDQAEVRESVGEMLRAMGHHVTLADSGEAALQIAARVRLDVLMTDLGMPGMNGLTVAQRFRVMAPGVPVVLLTGWGLEPDAVRPPNVRYVMGKPVTLRNLGDALATCAAEPLTPWTAKCS